MQNSYTGIVAACVLATGCAGSYSQKVIIPQIAIQKAVDSYFPMSNADKAEDDAPVKVTLSDAVVLLEEGSDQLGLEVKVTAELPEVDLPPSQRSSAAPPALPGPRLALPKPPMPIEDSIVGRVSIFVGLKYDPSDSSFYCIDPKIRELYFDSLPQQFDEPVRRATEQILKKYLSRNTVYTLSDDQLTTRLAKAALKSVQVEDGKLYVEIGI